MKRIFIAVALAATVTLGGCAAELAKFKTVYGIVTTATVPAPTAQVMVSSFEVLEAGATEYFKYCKLTPADTRCAPGTVAEPGPLRLAIAYDRQGRRARDQIKTAGKSGALISSTIYNSLADAVTNLTASPVSTFGAAK